MKYKKLIADYCPKTKERIFADDCQDCEYRRTVWISDRKKKQYRFCVQCLFKKD